MAEAAVLRQNKCVGSIKLVIESSSQHVDTFTMMSFVWMKNVVIECALNAILISANTSQILAIAYLKLLKDKLNNLQKVENDENVLHQVQPTCEQKENSEIASLNLSPISQNDDGMNGENVFNPTPTTSSHPSETKITENPQQLFSSVSYHPPAFGQDSSSRLFVHTPPSIKNTNKKRLNKIRS